jgi:hypothetical protein
LFHVNFRASEEILEKAKRRIEQRRLRQSKQETVNDPVPSLDNKIPAQSLSSPYPTPFPVGTINTETSLSRKLKPFPSKSAGGSDISPASPAILPTPKSPLSLNRTMAESAAKPEPVSTEIDETKLIQGLIFLLLTFNEELEKNLKKAFAAGEETDLLLLKPVCAENTIKAAVFDTVH